MNQSEKENIQGSFKRIKEEMSILQNEILDLKKQLSQTNKVVNYINSYLSTFIQRNSSSSRQSTDSQQIIKNPAQIKVYNGELSHKSNISTGNEGVPADSQQTVNRHNFEEKTPSKQSFQPSTSPSINVSSTDDKNKKFNLKEVSSVLEELKKELKQKFKNLTNQELLIFSLIYTLNEERSEVSYREISLRANLTESSVRDYISRLEHKGIPIIKERKNNKTVILKIPDELKHISTLDNLTKLSKN